MNISYFYDMSNIITYDIWKSELRAIARLWTNKESHIKELIDFALVWKKNWAPPMGLQYFQTKYVLNGACYKMPHGWWKTRLKGGAKGDFHKWKVRIHIHSFIVDLQVFS